MTQNEKGCGCKWVGQPIGFGVIANGKWQYCPLHASAPELLEALKKLAKYRVPTIQKIANQAIAAAEGKGRGTQ